MRSSTDSLGYYHVTITHRNPGRLLRSNNERAFIISQFQDLLSPRILIDTVPAHKQLASCIDLLAFSVRDTGIDLLLFTIDTHLASHLITHLMNRLAQYQNEYSSGLQAKNIPHPMIRLTKLTGPHQALATSVTIHSLHSGDGFDRYSSAGFYLHDRRGDWMRTWRLAQLYDNNPAHYRALMDSTLKKPEDTPSTVLRFAA